MKNSLFHYRKHLHKYNKIEVLLWYIFTINWDWNLIFVTCTHILLIEYWSVTSSNFLFCISAFSWLYFSRTWWKPLTTKFNMKCYCSWQPEIWPHEYLISSTEISVNWPGSIKFGLWMFFIMLHQCMVSKTLKCKKSFLWCHRFCTLLLWKKLWTLTQSKECQLLSNAYCTTSQDLD